MLWRVCLWTPWSGRYLPSSYTRCLAWHQEGLALTIDVLSTAVLAHASCALIAVNCRPCANVRARLWRRYLPSSCARSSWRTSCDLTSFTRKEENCCGRVCLWTPWSGRYLPSSYTRSSWCTSCDLTSFQRKEGNCCGGCASGHPGLGDPAFVLYTIVLAHQLRPCLLYTSDAADE